MIINEVKSTLCSNSASKPYILYNFQNKSVYISPNNYTESLYEHQAAIENALNN